MLLSRFFTRKSAEPLMVEGDVTEMSGERCTTMYGGSDDFTITFQTLVIGGDTFVYFPDEHAQAPINLKGRKIKASLRNLPNDDYGSSKAIHAFSEISGPKAKILNFMKASRARRLSCP